MRPFHLIVLVILVGGCCPVGCDEKALIRPGGTIVLRDTNGSAVSGATVTVIRYEKHPHYQALTDWQWRSDSDGQVVVSAEIGTITQYPLMMHGVASFAWQVCAESNGAVATSQWVRSYDFDPETPLARREKNLELFLEQSEVNCATAIEQDREFPSNETTVPNRPSR